MARAGDWVPCSGYGTPVTLAAAGAPLRLSSDTLLLTPGGDLASSTGEVASMELEGQVMSHRVVGWVLHRITTNVSEYLTIHERIRVGLRNDAGVGSFFAQSFEDPEDANEPFLWERVRHFTTVALVPVDLSSAEVGVPTQNAIDCRVKRMLGRDMALYYSMRIRAQLTGELTAGDTFTSHLYLRTWATSILR